MDDYSDNIQRSTLLIAAILIIVIILPITLLLLRQAQDLRSSAAAPDKLEVEAGVLSGNVQTLSDSSASGGQYIKFASNQTITPSPATSTGFYGQVARAGLLNNIKVGYSTRTSVGIRFKAKYTGQISAVRHYWQDKTAPQPNYSSGDGGTYRMSLQTVDSNGLPTGKILASRSNYLTSYYAGLNVSFSSPANVISGQRYVIVWENIHNDPVNNYGSMEGLISYGGDVLLGEDFPGEKWENLAVLRKDGTGPWQDKGWDKEQWLPIFDLTYTNGEHQGMGYILVAQHDETKGVDEMIKVVTGTKDLTRVRITPSNTITVSEIHVALLRDNSGTDPLKVDLKNNLENIIESSTIPASSFPVYTGNFRFKTPIYGTLTFKTPHTLTKGQTYYVDFSVKNGGSTKYKFAAMQRGIDYGYSPVTWWDDSDSFESSDRGLTWLNPRAFRQSRPSNTMEWMVYFTTQE